MNREGLTARIGDNGRLAGMMTYRQRAHQMVDDFFNDAVKKGHTSRGFVMVVPARRVDNLKTSYQWNAVGDSLDLIGAMGLVHSEMKREYFLRREEKEEA